MMILKRTLLTLALVAIALFECSQAIRCVECREVAGKGCKKSTECGTSFDRCITTKTKLGDGTLYSVEKFCGKQGPSCGYNHQGQGFSFSIECCSSDLCNEKYYFGNTNSAGETTTNLKCYNCVGEEKSECYKDPTSTTPVSCSSTYNTCHYTSGKSGDHGYVGRRCGLREDAVCGKTVNGLTTTCCDTSGCNAQTDNQTDKSAATSFSVNAGLLVAGLLAIYKAFYQC